MHLFTMQHLWDQCFGHIAHIIAQPLSLCDLWCIAWCASQKCLLAVVLFIDTLCYSENCALITSINSIFAAHAYARAVLGVVILSVCPSVTRVHCDKTKWCTADIFIPHERAITLLLWYQQWLVSNAPFPLKSAFKVTHPFEKLRLKPISAHNVSTIGDKGWLKERCFRFLSKSQRLIISSDVNLVRRSLS